ncbi:MAG: hypothetical protein IK139_07315 [Lachnospiraceae bacterium]|nr:hypothetical protein [Lachnospiraceae bacterium]
MKGTGYAIGIVVGIVLTLFLIRIWNKDGKMKTRYDEMQEKTRGKAYMYGFWTIMSVEAVLVVIISSDIRMPFDQISLHIIPILIGITVQASYSIWNGAYMGMNTNIKRFAIISTAVALVNILCAAGAFAGGGMMKDGVFEFPIINLFIGVMFVIIAGECLIKNSMDRKVKED